MKVRKTTDRVAVSRMDFGFHWEILEAAECCRRMPIRRSSIARPHVIVVNSGHRDFVFATRNRALQLRYLVRLYVKELVLKNFAGLPSDQLLERMVELSLHAEANLKSP